MSDNPQESGQNYSESQSQSVNQQSTRQQRREERRERRLSRTGGSLIGGVILILLGIVFIFQNMGMVSLTNWWALFILIPAVRACGAAWKGYQDAGGVLNGAARASLIGGLVLTLVSVTFLFNLNWGLVGPVLIILAGIGILLSQTFSK
jgi:hypothetical protein